MRRYVHSKWVKTQAIAASAAVRKHIPVTRLLTKDNLLAMLQQYKMVYVKPNIGTFGNGVMRVEWKEAGANSEANGSANSNAEKPYSYQEGTVMKAFEKYDELFESLQGLVKKKTYLVQQGVHLLKYKGRRFDLRVMVQQNPLRKWETTGIIGRVAQPGKIVTNFHNGGMLKPVETLLSGYLSEKERQAFVRDLRTLGVRVGKAMQRKFKGVREIGVDVALDVNLRPWILEVNTCPDPYIFRRLKDKRIFAKIIRYANSYGKR